MYEDLTIRPDKQSSFPHHQLDYKTKQIQSMYDAEEERDITPFG